MNRTGAASVTSDAEAGHAERDSHRIRRGGAPDAKVDHTGRRD
ncbi:hypothetical protein [Roseovarius atlanticus]|nr:hypothetical protein [Roseovarius atlanticus]